MTEADIKHIHQDVEMIKRDISLIKHLLLEEGELTKEAQLRVENARKVPLSKYKEL